MVRGTCCWGTAQPIHPSKCSPNIRKENMNLLIWNPLLLPFRMLIGLSNIISLWMQMSSQLAYSQEEHVWLWIICLSDLNNDAACTITFDANIFHLLGTKRNWPFSSLQDDKSAHWSGSLCVIIFSAYAIKIVITLGRRLLLKQNFIWKTANGKLYSQTTPFTLLQHLFLKGTFAIFRESALGQLFWQDFSEIWHREYFCCVSWLM